MATVTSFPLTTINTIASTGTDIARSIADHFSDTFHLKDFCSDLTTPGVDITAGLQAAIDALPASGGTIVLPSTPSATAYWTISSTINIGNGSVGVPSTRGGIRLVGAGSGGIYGTRGSYLAWGGATDGTMFSVNGPVENVCLEGLNLSGQNSAGTLIYLGACRFSQFRNVYGAGFKAYGLDVQGLAAAANNNIMLDIAFLYLSSDRSNAICMNFDGVIANSSDTWLSTVRNTRLDALGAGGIGLRLGFSDNILFEQLHAYSPNEPLAITGDISSGSPTVSNVTPTTDIAAGMYISGTGIPAGTKVFSIVGSTITMSANATATTVGESLEVVIGCGVLFDASTSLNLGNSFPSGHFFLKSAIQSTAVLEDADHTISVNSFADYGTRDNELVPTHPNLRGYTEDGEIFNNGISGVKELASPSQTTANGTAYHYVVDESGSSATVAIQANAGASVGAIYTGAGIPLYFGAGDNATNGGSVATDGKTRWFERARFDKSIDLAGSSSGLGTLSPPAAASSYVWTLPAATTTIVGTDVAQTLTNKTLTSPVISTISNTGTLTLPTSTDTLVGKATTDTFTNKTFNTAGTGNVFQINGTGITAVTGTGSVVLSASPTITGTLTTAGIAATVANSTSSINLLSGASNAYTAFSVGRTTADAFFGVSGATNQFVTGTAAGDTLMQANTSFFINNNGIITTKFDVFNNVVIGSAALTTSATAGWLWLTTSAGAPTGTPNPTYTGRAPCQIDTTNGRFYAYYGGAWHYAALT